MADSGQAWMLVQGTGRIYGTYVITSMTEGRTIFEANGDAARIDFSITLKRTDESVIGTLDRVSRVGSLSQLSDMMGLTGLANKAREISSTIGGIADRLPRLP
jgi:phage protein U